MGRKSSFKEGVVMSHVIFYAAVLFVLCSAMVIEFFGVF